MPVPRNQTRVAQSQLGLQEYLVIDAAPATDLTKLNVIAKDAGALAVNGNYDMIVDCSGLTNVEIILRQSAHGGGAVTPQVFTTFNDGTTLKANGVTAAAFADGVRQTIAFSALKGEKRIIVRIPIASQSVTLDQAEVNGK